MFNWWKTQRSQAETASEIYGAIVTRARNPAFYRTCGVSDTAEGRYEMVVLMLALVLERLRQAPSAPFNLQRSLVEAFVTDMDDCLREMGVGDLTVPKKVKRAAAGLMERMDQYRTARAASDTASLTSALTGNIPGLAATPGGADSLAASVRADAAHLARLADDAIVQGKISFYSEPDSSAQTPRMTP